jgi:hypothetical protein
MLQEQERWSELLQVRAAPPRARARLPHAAVPCLPIPFPPVSRLPSPARQVRKRKDHFIFKIESVGVLRPEQLLAQALDILSGKAKQLMTRL